MKYKEFLKNMTGCPFCEGENRVIFESDKCFLTYALWPYHKHHLLIIPKRHIESLFDLNEAEKRDIYEMQEKTLKVLRKIGYENSTHMVREGKSNKAVNHVHFHVIPNISIGDLDHYGQERKEISKRDIDETVEEIRKCLE